MSADGIKQVIGRAVSDVAFREQLFADPEAALAGFDLTADEIAQIKVLPRDSFNAGAGELEARISRAGIIHGDPSTDPQPFPKEPGKLEFPPLSRLSQQSLHRDRWGRGHSSDT